jgi:outer membrane lipoprotein-sorting protein
MYQEKTGHEKTDNIKEEIMMKKTVSLILAAAMIFTASLAMAKTVEPESTETNGLAGVTVHATVGEYDTQTKTFRVTFYDDDRFDIGKIEKLEAGDTLLAGGRLYKVKDKTEEENGDITVVTEDGYEIVFFQVGDDDMIAQSADDDRRYMHAFGITHLPAAATIRYEDNSDPEKEEAVVTEGLENILKIKAEKEADSIGFDFYATIITLNENMEIEVIHQDFDIAQ